MFIEIIRALYNKVTLPSAADVAEDKGYVLTQQGRIQLLVNVKMGTTHVVGKAFYESVLDLRRAATVRPTVAGGTVLHSVVKQSAATARTVLDHQRRLEKVEAYLKTLE